MASLNHVQLIGNLGADPEERGLGNGGKVVNMRIATSETWKDRDGERQEKTEWHTIVCFNDKIGEIIMEYLKKGDPVYVQGSLQTRKWEDRDGVERYTTEVKLGPYDSKLVLLGGRRDDNGGGGGRRSGGNRDDRGDGGSRGRDDGGRGGGGRGGSGRDGGTRGGGGRDGGRGGRGGRGRGGGNGGGNGGGRGRDDDRGYRDDDRGARGDDRGSRGREDTTRDRDRGTGGGNPNQRGAPLADELDDDIPF